MKTLSSSRTGQWMRRCGVFLVVAGLVLAMAGCDPDAETPAPPYDPEIRDWHDLHNMRYNPTRSYTLMNSLDAATAGYGERAGPTADEGRGWQPVGTPLNAFTGSFDGQGYEIGDLFIDRANPWDNHIGLFGYVGDGAVIENAALMNVNVTGYARVGSLAGHSSGAVANIYSTGSVSGDDRVGGIVGANTGQGSVLSSNSTGSVTGRQRIGGLVGENTGGTVSASSFAGNVTGDSAAGGLVGINADGGTVVNCHSMGGVAGGEWHTGGLVGSNDGTISGSYSVAVVIGDMGVGGLAGANDEEGTIDDSYAAGSVTGNSRVGGLAGFNSGTVNRSYSTGSVTGDDMVGGLVGRNLGEVVNSYWNRDTSGMEESAGGVGKTTIEMQSLATFEGEGWDIVAVAGLGQRNTDSIWNIVDGVTHPFLSWEPIL